MALDQADMSGPKALPVFPQVSHLRHLGAPTLQQISEAMRFIHSWKKESIESWEQRSCVPEQVPPHEERSYVWQFNHLMGAVEEMDKKLVLYHALFNDEIRARRLVDLIVIAKKQRSFLLMQLDPPLCILSPDSIRALLVEFHDELDRLYKMVASIAPLSTAAQYEPPHPDMVDPPFRVSHAPKALSQSSPPVRPLSSDSVDRAVVPCKKVFGSVCNDPVSPLAANPPVERLTATQWVRIYSNNIQTRWVVVSSIFLLGLLQIADTSFDHLRSHCASVPPITVHEFHKRQNNLARVLHSSNASAYIAEPGANALYFGNISASAWHLSERPLLLIITPTRTPEGEIVANMTIVTPKFEATRAKLLSVPSANVTYVEWAEDEDPYKAAVSAISRHAGNNGKIFLSESSRLFIRDGIQAAAPEAMVVSAPQFVRSLRERKSAAEIALLRCANEVTLLAIRAVRDKMHIGIDDSTTKKLVMNALASAGLENPSAIVLFGEDAALPHGSGTHRDLRKEDLILFDVGGTLHGYYSDVTRTFALAGSKIPLDHLELWRNVSLAQLTALVTATRGMPTHLADDMARNILVNAGYGKYFTHRLGHGIGLEGHEAPYLRGGSEDIIQTGNTFSDEPGVYIEGKVGIRLEDCFVITRNGLPEYLTKGVGGAAHSPWHP